MAIDMIGRYFHNVDNKGRVIVPAKIRDYLGSEFVITESLDKCLYIFPQSEWDKFAAKLDMLGNSKTTSRNIRRFFLSNAAYCEIDGQGRTVIPQTLRKDANIEKEVVILGVGNKAEIWAKEEYDKLLQTEEFSKEAMRQNIEELDLDF